jgi:histone H2B
MAKIAAKKAPKSVKKDVTKKRRKGKRTFNSFIFKVMKQVHPESRISKKGMLIVNNFVTDTFERVCAEASKLCKYSNRSTLSARDVQSALRLVLPGELSKHAVSEGTKAMTKFNSA